MADPTTTVSEVVVTAKRKLQARQPRGLLNINGQRVPFLSWEVDQNSFYAADTFRFTVAISSLPSGRDATWWAGVTEIDVEIFAGFPPNPDSFTIADLQSLIVGRVDELTYDPHTQTIEASGRDLTGLLIDDKVTLKLTNQTSSQIATKLATQYGLTPVVKATSTKVGVYYQIEHAKADASKPAWDLLTWLARKENFVVYIQGKELHFEPAPTAKQTPRTFTFTPPSGAIGYSSFDGTDIKVSRSLTLAKDVRVEVRSWNAKTKRVIIKTAQAAHSKNRVARRSPIPTGETQTYSYTIPGLTPEAAQNRANQLAVEISAHEVKLEIEGPADNHLSRTDVIQLKGTPFDQVFFPDSIVRQMSIDEGYNWRIEAKNHSPESEPPL